MTDKLSSTQRKRSKMIEKLAKKDSHWFHFKKLKQCVYCLPKRNGPFKKVRIANSAPRKKHVPSSADAYDGVPVGCLLYCNTVDGEQ